jgi:hypothetical protein
LSSKRWASQSRSAFDIDRFTPVTFDDQGPSVA